MSVCDNCPRMAAFDATDELVSECGSAHRAPGRARALVGLQRRAAELLAARCQCPGPCVNRDGQVACAISNLVQWVADCVVFRWADAQHDVDIDALSETASAAPGAML